MADISYWLNQIMSAIYGRDVRSSIHDSIEKINDVTEHTIDSGIIIHAGDASSTYDNVYYFNSDTNDLLRSNGTTWNLVSNLEGNAITSITGPVTDPNNPLLDVYTIHFSKISNRTFNVYNGRGINSISGPTVDPSNPLVDNYVITLNDETTIPYQVANGKGIVSIVKTSTLGLVDTYTITFNDNTTQNYNVINGKDGITWLHGLEISGKALASTGYTLANDDCKAGDMYFQVSEGAVYGCDIGAEAGSRSYWSCLFVMSGGAGATYLYALLDIDATSTQTPANGQILKYNGTTHLWEASYGGSGHDMAPEPDPTQPVGSQLTEDDVVEYFKSKYPQTYETNQEVASIFSLVHWTNLKRIRKIYNGQIGHTGIGTWKDGVVSSADQADWWEDAIFALLDTSDPLVTGWDVDMKIMVDPEGGEPITLGGWIIDTTTHKMCIRFANYVIDPSKARISVDLTFTRTDVSETV